MQLHDSYSDEIFEAYMDGLQKGDDVIVKQNGHEFVKMRVTSTGDDVVRCGGAYHFDLDGVGIKRPSNIMLPTQVTFGQWETCEYRKKLANQFDELYTIQKFRKKRVEDMEFMIKVMRQR